MAGEHSAQYERMSLEECLTLVERDPEHAYEYIDGCGYMVTGGSLDHAIIGSNLNGLLLSSELPLVEVFRRQKQEVRSLHTFGLGDTIELSDLGLRFPVAELYRNSSLLEEANDNSPLEIVTCLDYGDDTKNISM